MVCLQLGRDMQCTCPEKCLDFLRALERLSLAGQLLCGWTHTGVLWTGLLKPEQRVLARYLKQMPALRYRNVASRKSALRSIWGFLRSLQEPCLPHPFLLFFCVKFGGASFLRTKVMKLLRFGLHQESTTSSLSGRFSGLTTDEQGYSHLLSLKERNALLGTGNSGSSYVADLATRSWPAIPSTIHGSSQLSLTV